MESENNFLQNENEIKSPLKVVYILYVGKNTDNDNIYHFFFLLYSDKTWAEGW